MEKPLNKNKRVLIICIIGIILIAVGVILAVFVFPPDSDSSGNAQTTSGAKFSTQKNQTLTEFNSDYYSTSTTSPSTTYKAIPNSILIDAEMQENLNTFLSNFSEANFELFSKEPSVKNLVQFALIHNHINKGDSVFEDADVAINGKDFDKKIHQKYVIQTIQQYFGISLTADKFSDFDYYSDEHFYSKASEQKISFGFSIANNLESVGAGVYQVEFAIYDSSEYDNLHNFYTIRCTHSRC